MPFLTLYQSIFGCGGSEEEEPQSDSKSGKAGERSKHGTGILNIDTSAAKWYISIVSVWDESLSASKKGF